MLAGKLLKLLARGDIKEIKLQSGSPPCAVVGDGIRRVSALALSEDEIIDVLSAAGGGRYLLRLEEGVSWDQAVPELGTVRVTAQHNGKALKASMQLLAASTPAQEPAPQPAPARPAAPVAAAAPPRPAVDRNPSRSFDIAADDAVVDASAYQAPEAPVVSAVVVTTHDAFNFAPASAWGSRPPPAAEGHGQAARVQVKRKLRFVGDQLDELFGNARELSASDLHLLADRPAMFRIAGELKAQGEPIPSELATQLVMARVPAKLHAQLEQHGSCDFALVHEAYGRFRVNVTRQRTGIKLTARPIGEQVPTLDGLGLPKEIGRALHHHQGLIVVAGPTGEGKTTTLAAIVGIINRETSHHVITVEDPIEYVHENAKAVISQREVGTHTKSFGNALKGSLREDPDVIVVGELRDTETVRMALSASETGHLVISTMNTPSAAKAIERLIDLFPPGDQPQVRMTLAGGLRLVIAQRLVPTADRSGLCVAAEVLPGVTQLWALIRDSRTYQIANLQQRGKSLGIVRIEDSLAQLVKAGTTTLEIAREYCESPELLESLVTGKPMIERPKEDEKAPPGQAAAAASAAASAAQKKGKELGKQVMSRAGKLFGGDSK